MTLNAYDIGRRIGPLADLPLLIEDAGFMHQQSPLIEAGENYIDDA